MNWFRWEPEIERELDYISLWREIKLLYPDLENDSMTDLVYRVPKNPFELLKRFPHKNLPYITNKRDCEDFVYGFKWWVAKKGWGDLLIMNIKIFVPGKGMHRLVGFLHEGKIVMGEPNGGKIVDYPGCVIKSIIV